MIPAPDAELDAERRHDIARMLRIIADELDNGPGPSSGHLTLTPLFVDHYDRLTGSGQVVNRETVGQEIKVELLFGRRP